MWRWPEREEQRLDRELIELLNELRVALPGVQVLFAFLLTVPFSQRFTTLGIERAAARTSSRSCSPRCRARSSSPRRPSTACGSGSGPRRRIVKVGSACTFIGLTFLAGAVGVSLHLITTVLYDSSTPASSPAL